MTPPDNAGPAATEVTPSTPFSAEDDTFHRLSDDPFETETNWWAFNVPARRMGCWVHAAVRPNRDEVTWRVFVWDERAADPIRLAYYRSQDAAFPKGQDLRDITFPQGGYRLKAISPLSEYVVAFEDPARDFALDFRFRALYPPRRATPGEPPAMFNPHLDQLGRLTGAMRLAGETIALDGLAIRDRTWGPRGGAHMTSQKASYRRGETRVLHPGGPRWREIERERGQGRIQYIFGHCDERTGFLSFVRPQDGDADGWSPLNNGWLLKHGEMTNLDKSRSRMKTFRDPQTGWNAHMLVEAHDAMGRSLVAEGFAVSHMCEHGGGSNALFRWDIEGKVGWGEDQDSWRPDHFRRMLDALRATA